MHAGVFGPRVVRCSVFVWQVPDEWMLAPGRASRLLGRGCCVGSASRGVSHYCCHNMHTDLMKVTDAGLKAFSAALGSSPTITTVTLDSKSD